MMAYSSTKGRENTKNLFIKWPVIENLISSHVRNQNEIKNKNHNCCRNGVPNVYMCVAATSISYVHHANGER